MRSCGVCFWSNNEESWASIVAGVRSFLGSHWSNIEELVVGATLRRQFVPRGIFFTCKNLFLLSYFFVQIWKLKRVFFVKEMNIEAMHFFCFHFHIFSFDFQVKKWHLE